MFVNSRNNHNKNALFISNGVITPLAFFYLEIGFELQIQKVWIRGGQDDAIENIDVER